MNIERVQIGYLDVKNRPFVNGTGVLLSGEAAAGGATTSQNVSYSNPAFPQYSNVKLALDAILDDLFYTEPNISQFTASINSSTYSQFEGSVAEVGDIVTSCSLSWNYNPLGNLNWQKFADMTDPLNIADRNRTVSGPTVAINPSRTFTLNYADGIKILTGAPKSSTTTINFRRRGYYGASSTGTLTDAQIRNFSIQPFITSRSRSLQIVPNGAFLYLAWPTNLGEATQIRIGIFDSINSFTRTTYTNFTNKSNNPTDYYIYKSNNILNGTTPLDIVIS
jgi:hypothetical protein